MKKRKHESYDEFLDEQRERARAMETLANENKALKMQLEKISELAGTLIEKIKNRDGLYYRKSSGVWLPANIESHIYDLSDTLNQKTAYQVDTIVAAKITDMRIES